MSPCKPTPGRTATCTNRTWGDGAAPSPPSSWTGSTCRPAGRWLDVGCGTGALSETVLVRAEPAGGPGIDQSEGFVKYAAQHLGRPEVRGAGRRRTIAAVRRRVVRRGRLRVGAELRPEPPRRLAEDSCARRGARRDRGRSTSGTTPAACRSCAGSGMPRRRWIPPPPNWTRAFASRCARPARSPISSGGRAGRDLDLRARGSHRVSRLRRLLGAVPRGPGPGAGLRRVAPRGAPSRLARADPRGHAHGMDGTIRLTARAWAVQGRRRVGLAAD